MGVAGLDRRARVSSPERAASYGERDIASHAVPSPHVDDSAELFVAISREPCPEEAAMLAETLEDIFRGENKRGRQILVDRLQEYTEQEIRQRIGCSEHTVRRVVQRAEKEARRAPGELAIPQRDGRAQRVASVRRRSQCPVVAGLAGTSRSAGSSRSDSTRWSRAGSLPVGSIPGEPVAKLLAMHIARGRQPGIFVAPHKANAE